MDYAQVSAAIADTIENDFRTEDLDRFITFAEQKIYNVVQLPALRKNVTGNLTAGNKYLAMPTDFLYVYSLAVVGADGSYEFILDKDVNFIREAYPYPLVSGKPKHYAVFDATSFIVGPTPDASYEAELHYGYYPESLVTAGTTWVSENFESALVNLAIVEAARFIKADPEMLALYEKLSTESLALLKNLGDGKLRQDSYRSGQVRVPVR
jgi:hypothetical protein